MQRPPISKARVVRNSLVRESLIDMADRDYITARVCWKTRLPHQFLWSSLQAIEKQLKAILLFNDRSAKGLGHNIDGALQKVCAITELRFDPPDVIRQFVRYLNVHAPNRYLERPFRVRGSEIFELDRAFWHFRRYCQDFRSTAEAIGKPIDEWLELHQRWFADPEHKRVPYRFRLFGGYLEEVLDGKHGPEQYTALVWKNVYYGKRDKGRIEYQPLTWISEPAHIRHPDVFDELAEILDFPKDVRKALSRKAKPQ